MSTARYHSGQKTVDCASTGARYAGLEKASCACSVRVARNLDTNFLTQDLSRLDRFIVSLLPSPFPKFFEGDLVGHE